MWAPDPANQKCTLAVAAAAGAVEPERRLAGTVAAAEGSAQDTLPEPAVHTVAT